jgi:hypothetical protein
LIPPLPLGGVACIFEIAEFSGQFVLVADVPVDLSQDLIVFASNAPKLS